MDKLDVKNYRQQVVTVATSSGFRPVVRVSYDVFHDGNAVGTHSVDYPADSASTQQITTDMQTYVRELRTRIAAAAAAGS